MPAATKKYTIQSKQQDGSMTTMYPETDGTVVHYDNSTSGLTASNAQAAIDELKTLVDNNLGIVDLGTFNVGENTISTELSQAALSDDCKFVKVTTSETEQEMILAKSMCIPSIQTALFEYVVVDDKNNAYQTYLQIVGTTVIIAENNINVPRIRSPLANETYKLVGVPSDYSESGFDLFRTSEIASSDQVAPSADLIVGGLFFKDV